MLRDPDDALLRDCLSEQPGAWEAFHARFTPPLSAACRRALARAGRPSGAQETADMLQAVFVHLLEDDLHVLRAYRGESGVLTYLSVVAVNLVWKDRLLRLAPGGGELLADRPAPDANPAARMEAGEARELLGRELGKLPVRARLALTFQAEGASIREVGLALGLSEVAAAQLLSRARASLRQKLEAGGIKEGGG